MRRVQKSIGIPVMVFVTLNRPQMTPAQRAPIPEFGVRLAGIGYIDRPSVYAVIANYDSKIAIIETGNGYFLPGGGINVAESDVEALKREIFEEIGYQAEVLEKIGEAIEYIRVFSDGKNYQIRGRFYKAQLGSKVGEGIEKDHRLVWLQQVEACRLLVRQSQVWAVRRTVTG